MSTQLVVSMDLSIRTNAKIMGISRKEARVRMYRHVIERNTISRKVRWLNSDWAGFYPGAYRPNYWATKRQSARARKASVTQASKILGVSKSDARAWKVKQARNRDKLNYFQPNDHNLRLGKLSDWAEKRAAIRAKRYPQNKHLWPEFVRFEIETVNDDSPDLSHLGRFTDTWQPGAIFHSKDPQTYLYFVPGNSYQSHVKSLQKMGYSKGEANYLAGTYTQQDYKRMKEYGESWSMVGVCVKAYIGDIEIGRDSLWGIEDDSGDAYMKEVEEDCKLCIWHDLDMPTLATLATHYLDLAEQLKTLSGMI